MVKLHVVDSVMPAIPGCVSQRGSREEAESNLREAIIGCLEVRAEQGMPLTVETRTVDALAEEVPLED